jgi:hypothetical protein
VRKIWLLRTSLKAPALRVLALRPTERAKWLARTSLKAALRGRVLVSHQASM